MKPSKQMVDFPCSFCCKMMTFPKTDFVNGGVVKCKYCGTKTRFKPHPDMGKKPVNRKRWAGSTADLSMPDTMGTK